MKIDISKLVSVSTYSMTAKKGKRQSTQATYNQIAAGKLDIVKIDGIIFIKKK